MAVSRYSRHFACPTGRKNLQVIQYMTGVFQVTYAIHGSCLLAILDIFVYIKNRTSISTNRDRKTVDDFDSTTKDCPSHGPLRDHGLLRATTVIYQAREL